MNSLGICPHTLAVYEGSPSSGTRIFPSPLLLPLRFQGADGLRPIDDVGGYSAEIFREESFDPITKIRRGRVFSRRSQISYQEDWRVQDPWRTDLPVEDWAHGKAQKINLLTWASDLMLDLRKAPTKRLLPKVVLGWQEHCTYWQIVMIETPIRSGPVLTLKALHSLGDLPELLEEKIPDSIRTSVVEAWDKLDATANRFSPVDTVDRSRDLLSIVFSHLSSEPHFDLSDAINAYLKGKKEDAHSSSGRIVARLHVRGKPNEQQRLNLRSLSDADAQLALRCVGLILTDLGWAQ